MTGKTHAACGAATMLALTVLHRSGLPIGAETYTPALGLLTVVVGSYAPDVDLKNSTLGEGTKLPHLIYVGDSDVGAHCNFGCGSITCNYDGNYKYRTTVGDDAFIGCNTNLVSPCQVGDGAYTAAGTTITGRIPADALAIGRVEPATKPGWARRHRAKKTDP